MYQKPVAQIAVAAVIGLNFVCSAWDASTKYPRGSPGYFVFKGFEWTFAIVFTIELFINMYGGWHFQMDERLLRPPRCSMPEFWCSGWNVFDFLIVGISILSLAFEDLPGINVLRLFRVFRVFRLFKRIESLKHIIEGVLTSMPGVANAFVVLTIFMGIWSIIGVEFFGKDDQEAFGTFSRAMFTMFQTMTTDAWAANIARPLMYNGDDVKTWQTSIFFVSYIFLAGIVIANVVVAVLLDAYLGSIGGDEDDGLTDEQHQEEADKAKLESMDKIMAYTLDTDLTDELEIEDLILIINKLHSFPHMTFTIPTERIQKVQELCGPGTDLMSSRNHIPDDGFYASEITAHNATKNLNDSGTSLRVESLEVTDAEPNTQQQSSQWWSPPKMF